MNHTLHLLPWNLNTADKIDLCRIIPELDTLKQVIEQSDWHNDDAYQQSWRLFEWVKQLPASLLGMMSLPEAALQNLLHATVDYYYTKQALLAFAALIHDVGKANTFQLQADGTTQCPGHEIVSATMALSICARFDFSPAETNFITTLVRAHGEPYALFKRISALPVRQQQEQIRRFEAQHADYLRPLLLLAWGDMITSHLHTIRPEKYEAVFDFYQRWLQSIWPEEREDTNTIDPH